MAKTPWTTERYAAVGVSLPRTQLKSLDRLARRKRISRSRMISQLLDEAMAHRLLAPDIAAVA